uniref:Uncharacterized protein n=1 Tax=Anopheles funestus TaxID=62324 RepID=A0A4Y0BMV7_ANOFN
MESASMAGIVWRPRKAPKSLPRVHRPRARINSNNGIFASPSTAHDRMMVVRITGQPALGATIQQQQQQHPATSPPTQPPKLSPKPRHLIGGSVSSSSQQSKHGSNSSTLSSVSSSSSTVALLRPHQIAPLVPLHSRSATPPPPPLPPHQRPTSPAGSVSGSTGSTFARRRLSPATTNPPSLHHPHLTSIPLGSGNEPTATAGGAPPVLLLPVDQPIVPANNNTNASNPTTPVTLAAPRPENERLANEYVDTPFGRSHNNGSMVGGGGVPNIPSTGGLVPGLQQGINQQHRNLSLLVAGDTVVVPVITGQPRPTVDRTRSPIIGIGGNSDATGSEKYRDDTASRRRRQRRPVPSVSR